MKLKNLPAQYFQTIAMDSILSSQKNLKTFLKRMATFGRIDTHVIRPGKSIEMRLYPLLFITLKSGTGLVWLSNMNKENSVRHKA